jgi:hypothetical protein
LIVLDENILDGQRLLLEASRFAPRQIGVNMKDEQLLVLFGTRPDLKMTKCFAEERPLRI